MLSAERPAARAYLVVGVAIVVLALVIQVPITAHAAGGFFTTPATRVGNLFTYFTILSNVARR